MSGPTRIWRQLLCATLADSSRWDVLVDAFVHLDHAAVLWTVVTDKVASVTLKFTSRTATVTNTVARTVHPVGNVVVA